MVSFDEDIRSIEKKLSNLDTRLPRPKLINQTWFREEVIAGGILLTGIVMFLYFR